MNTSNQRAVTIIVPIYNTEKYIEKCIVSLFEQDFDDIEYIFVNDCTPDKSIEILESVIERYPNRKPNCKIFHNEINRGTGYTRTVGMKNATGKYTIQIDSDDYCEQDMISAMYEKAEKEDLDMLIADYYQEFDNKNGYVHKPIIKDPLSIEISGKRHGGLCVIFVKRDLYIEHKIFPPENISMAEDRYVIIRLTFYALKIGYMKHAYLHVNRKTENISLTRVYNKKIVDDLIFFFTDLEYFLKEKNIFNKYENEFKNLIILFYSEFYKYNNDFVYKKYNKLISLSDILRPNRNKNLLKQLFRLFKILLIKKYKKERCILLFHIKNKFKHKSVN